MSNVFFTSDQHYYHSRIIKYCDRPFSSVEEMNEKLIDNHNSIIKQNDTVYMLGDFAWLNDVDKLTELFKRLNGIKHFILGNHDNPNCFRILADNKVIASLNQTLGIKIDKQYIWLSHYSHRVWDKSHHGSWALFGHSHATLSTYGLSFDIGVDTNNYFPWSYEDVKIRISQLQLVQKQLEHGVYV